MIVSLSIFNLYSDALCCFYTVFSFFTYDVFAAKTLFNFIFCIFVSVVLLYNQEIQAPAYAVYDLPHSVLLGPI